MAGTLYILNGPNLNLLGTREPDIYGTTTLDEIAALCDEKARAGGFTTDFRQTNAEGELVTWIQEARTKAAAVIINAGAYTHTSVAVLDALTMCDIPVVEVHLSNPYARETFRHTSFVSPVATGVICGFGANGYALAIDAIQAHLAG